MMRKVIRGGTPETRYCAFRADCHVWTGFARHHMRKCTEGLLNGLCLMSSSTHHHDA